MTFIRPAKPRAPIAVSGLVLLVWWMVAHNSGSGWVQLLGDAVFGTIVVGILGPAVSLSLLRTEFLGSSKDGTVGLPMILQIRTTARVRVRPIEPPGPEAMVGPTQDGTYDDDLVMIASKRGVYEKVIVELSTAWPFALQWWSRRTRISLSDVLHVAPRLGDPVPLREFEADRAGERLTQQAAQTGTFRGVRPYEPGDLRRRVHWPSSAHTGRLMMRETEEPSSKPVTLRVTLPYDDSDADVIAGRALGTAAALLDRGRPVIMATDEREGPVTAPVRDRLEAGRRLARAVAASGEGQVEVSDEPD